MQKFRQQCMNAPGRQRKIYIMFLTLIKINRMVFGGNEHHSQNICSIAAERTKHSIAISTSSLVVKRKKNLMWFEELP